MNKIEYVFSLGLVLHSFESLIILFLGLISIICMLIKSSLKRAKISSIPFFIIFGIIAKQLIEFLPYNLDSFYEIVKIFGDIGLILILFQVGVESNLKTLLEQINNALLISISEVIISGLVLFFTFYYLLSLSFKTSVILSIAFTATSIAIAVNPWKESGLLKQKSAQLILDLSAMDDIAGILLMVVAVSFFNNYFGTSSFILEKEFILSFLWIIIKLLLLVVLAYAFSVFIEPKLSKIITKYEISPDPVVTILCLALIFSALAGFYGLSIALGSFLIGLSFSRDPSAVRLLASYQSLESFFIPFFFFSIGFSVTQLAAISWISLIILFAAALVGKVVGVGVPSYFLKKTVTESLLLGLSMIPRAEVSLVVIGYAKSVFHIPPKIFSECILVVLMTCFFPIVLNPLIQLLSKKQQNKNRIKNQNNF